MQALAKKFGEIDYDQLWKELEITISADHKGKSVEERLSETLEQWLRKSDEPPTWGDLVNVLTKVGESCTSLYVSYSHAMCFSAILVVDLTHVTACLH